MCDTSYHVDAPEFGSTPTGIYALIVPEPIKSLLYRMLVLQQLVPSTSEPSSVKEKNLICQNEQQLRDQAEIQQLYWI